VINILAVGLTAFLNRALFFQQEVPHAPGVLPTIRVPLLADIPVAGRIFQQQPITLLAIVLVVFTHWVLFYTRWGLRTRAVGEHPLAADTVGIRVIAMRYRNVIVAGLIAGIGGAYFTIGSVGSFGPNMSSGEGYIALAAMIFGRYTPFGAIAAARLFGFTTQLQSVLSSINVPIQSNLLLLTPYVVTIIVVVGLVGKVRGPR